MSSTRQFIVTIAAVLICAAPVMSADREVQPDDGKWTLNGRVIDEEKRPVENVDISTYWSANGITIEQIRKIEKQGGEHPECAQNKGKMEPWGLNPVKTDAMGSFSIKMQWNHYFVYAIDKERKRGALRIIDQRNVPSSVDLQIAPLVRVSGTIRIPSASVKPKEPLALVRLPLNENCPLGQHRVALCGTEKSCVEFLLPPGKYEFESAGYIEKQRYELAEFKPFTVPAGQQAFDAGNLDLTPEPITQFDRIQDEKAKGEWVGVDRQQLLGKPAPKWHAVDVRGISKDAHVSDFKGKWVLVYFWDTGCAGCLGRTIPRLIKFYEAHKAQRDNFEIVAICLEEPEIKSMADLDRELKSVVKAVWGGKPLPFPTILDNTLITTEHFGADQRGNFFLFDPNGKFVEGDDKTLAEKLKAGPESTQKP